MKNAQSWLVQVYQMTGDEPQAEAAKTLAALPGCDVDARTCERGSFLIVGCHPDAALSIYELVMMADHDAELIHSTAGPVTEAADAGSTV